MLPSLRELSLGVGREITLKDMLSFLESLSELPLQKLSLSQSTRRRRPHDVLQSSKMVALPRLLSLDLSSGCIPLLCHLAVPACTAVKLEGGSLESPHIISHAITSALTSYFSNPATMTDPSLVDAVYITPTRDSNWRAQITVFMHPDDSVLRSTVRCLFDLSKREAAEAFEAILEICQVFSLDKVRELRFGYWLASALKVTSQHWKEMLELLPSLEILLVEGKDSASSLFAALGDEGSARAPTGKRVIPGLRTPVLKP